MSNRRNLQGMTFGRLLVKEASCTKNGRIYWQCLCECGSTTTVMAQSLLSGRTMSCGCLWREVSATTRYIKHGMKNTITYQTWAAMRDRCKNPNNHNYPNYGGRGICVCKEWDSFSEFLKDMGERTKEHSLDRIDNNKGYFPENCRWATAEQQANNKRNSIRIEYKENLYTIKQLASILMVNKSTLYLHLFMSGWSAEELKSKGIKIMGRGVICGQ